MVLFFHKYEDKIRDLPDGFPVRPKVFYFEVSALLRNYQKSENSRQLDLPIDFI